MTAPRTVDDGSNLIARQHGATEWEFPFASEGDASAWVAKITMRQDQSKFRPLAPMSQIKTTRGIGYLVSPEDTQNIGQGRVEWTRHVANVPRSRTVPSGTASLNLQLLIKKIPDTGPITYALEEYPLAVPGNLTYEYATSAIPVLRAPRVIVYNEGKNYQFLGDWGNMRIGRSVLCQDSEHSLYRGLIQCRTTQRGIIPASFGQ